MTSLKQQLLLTLISLVIVLLILIARVFITVPSYWMIAAGMLSGTIAGFAFNTYAIQSKISGNRIYPAPSLFYILCTIMLFCSGILLLFYWLNIAKHSGYTLLHLSMQFSASITILTIANYTFLSAKKR